MAHLTGTSRLFAGCNRVSSSDDSDGTILGDISKDVHNSESSSRERLHLENSHGSVHDDGLAGLECLTLRSGGSRTVIKSHPAIRDLVYGNRLDVGSSREIISDDDIKGKDDLLSELLGLGQNFLGSFNEFILAHGGSNVQALGLEEGENHTSSNDDLVALVEKGVQDGDLGRNLGSTDDGGHGGLTARDGSIKVLELLSEQEPTNSGAEELGHTLSGSMRTVGGTESIVDEHIERSGELLNEAGLVLGLLSVETGVLKHDHIALFHGVNQSGDIISDAVTGELDFLLEDLSHALGARCERELVLGAILRASQMRADGDLGSLGNKVLDGGDGGTDAGVISDGLSVKGDVDIATDEDLLSLKLLVGEVGDGLLRFEGNGGANAEVYCYLIN